MSLELHSKPVLQQNDSNIFTGNARSKTMVQVITKFLSIAFSLFPVSDMYAVIRLSPGLIGQNVFDAIGMDGASGDILSYLLILFDVIFRDCTGEMKGRARNKVAGVVIGASSAVKVLLASTTDQKEEENSLEHNLLSVISSLLTVRSHALRHLLLAPFKIPPGVSQTITTTCINIITSPLLSKSKDISDVLLLSCNILSILLRNSSNARVSVKTTSNDVHRNLIRSLLRLLTPSNPVPQVIGALSILAKLVNNEAIEEKVFDASNVEVSKGDGWL